MFGAGKLIVKTLIRNMEKERKMNEETQKKTK